MLWLIVILAGFVFLCAALVFLGYVIYEIGNTLKMEISFGRSVVFAFLLTMFVGCGAVTLILGSGSLN